MVREEEIRAFNDGARKILAAAEATNTLLTDFVRHLKIKLQEMPPPTGQDQLTSLTPDTHNSNITTKGPSKLDSTEEVMKKNIYFNNSNPDSINAKTNLSKSKWIVGVINDWDFYSFQEYLTTESEEEIYQLFLKNKELNVKLCEKVTVLMPESLPEDLKFRPNLDNRFVFCAAEMNIKDAEVIQKHFVLNLLLTIFPKVPNISAAFYFYDGRYLELGIYLTGIPCVEVPVDRSVYRWPEDIALPVGHKLKQMILVNAPSCKMVDVKITNAIPSDSAKYTSEIYEYQKSKRIFLKC